MSAGTAFAAVLAKPMDPMAAILIAANHRAIMANGELGDLQDIDCYGCVTGALAGAVAGAEAFPDGMLDSVIEANVDVYGIDLNATVDAVVSLTG